MSPRRVKSAIAELKQAGIVWVYHRNRRNGETNVYTLEYDQDQVTKNVTQNEPLLGDEERHLENVDSGRLGDGNGLDQVTQTGKISISRFVLKCGQ